MVDILVLDGSGAEEPEPPQTVELTRVPCVGEYIGLPPWDSADYHKVTLVVHNATGDGASAEIRVVRVNHLEAIAQSRAQG